MKLSLTPFENYVTSLTTLGVFPMFNRHFNGWTCILKNGVNTQIMPPEGEECWGETMIEALTIAVDALNRRFDKPEELHKYINTGVCQDIESLLMNIELMYQLKPLAKSISSDNSDSEKIRSEFLH